MKRSEMVGIIESILHNCESSNAMYNSAGEILTAIEQAGMLAPKHNFGPEYFTEGNFFDQIRNEWEPEDDD